MDLICLQLVSLPTLVSRVLRLSPLAVFLVQLRPSFFGYRCCHVHTAPDYDPYNACVIELIFIEALPIQQEFWTCGVFFDVMLQRCNLSCSKFLHSGIDI